MKICYFKWASSRDWKVDRTIEKARSRGTGKFFERSDLGYSPSECIVYVIGAYTSRSFAKGMDI